MMRLTGFALIVCCILGVLAGSASKVHGQTWSRSFDHGGLTALGPDGRIVLVSNTEYPFFGDQVTVSLLEPSGVMLGSTTLGFEYDDQAADVAFLSDGAIAVASVHGLLGGGHFTGGREDVTVTVFEPDLSMRWQLLLPTLTEDYSPRMAVADDGGLLVVSEAPRMEDGTRGWWGVRVDAAGNILWQKVWGRGGQDTLHVTDLVATADGGFVVSGHSRFDGHDMVVGRLDGNGDLLWARRYGSFQSVDHDEQRPSLAIADDGSIYVCGLTESFGGESWDWLVAKLDADGQILWSSVADGAPGPGAGPDRLGGCVASAEGLLVLGGRPRVGVSQTTPWAMRLDHAGALVWSRVWSDYGDRSFLNGHATPVGGWLISAKPPTEQDYPGELLWTDDGGLLRTACEPGRYAGLLPAPVVIEHEDVSLLTESTLIAPGTDNPGGGGALQASVEGCIGRPAEVSRSGSQAPLRFSDVQRLEWEGGAATNATGFDLYRGLLTDLSQGLPIDCLLPGLTLPEAVDPDVPAPGSGFGYLVGGTNGEGAGSLGRTSGGEERLSAGCP